MRRLDDADRFAELDRRRKTPPGIVKPGLREAEVAAKRGKGPAVGLQSPVTTEEVAASRLVLQLDVVRPDVAALFDILSGGVLTAAHLDVADETVEQRPVGKAPVLQVQNPLRLGEARSPGGIFVPLGQLYPERALFPLLGAVRKTRVDSTVALFEWATARNEEVPLDESSK